MNRHEFGIKLLYGLCGHILVVNLITYFSLQKYVKTPNYQLSCMNYFKIIIKAAILFITGNEKV